MQRRFAISFSILILWAGAASCAPAPDFVDSSIPAETPAGFPPDAVSSPTAEALCVSSVHPRDTARVTAVTDGDSFEIEMNGVDFRVRLIGLDAPEMGREPLAEESRAALRELLDGHQIIMVRDRSEADRYGRLLRFVFVDGVFVNREIIRLGLAEENPYPPDTACTDEFRAAEEEARQEGSGLWELETAGGGLMDAVGQACREHCATPPPGCLIKGNINLEGDKIYHVPAGEYYAQTEIEPEKGERWFCSEAEAAAAGWRRSKR